MRENFGGAYGPVCAVCANADAPLCVEKRKQQTIHVLWWAWDKTGGAENKIYRLSLSLLMVRVRRFCKSNITKNSLCAAKSDWRTHTLFHKWTDGSCRALI
jgi:hypothetical protein